MSDQSDLGKAGEAFAAEHLRKNDYIILKQNYVWKKAEVDIIAKKNNKVIFVEVKTRAAEFMNEAALMVPRSKQKQIIKAADAFLKAENIELNSRFDIISVVLNSKQKKLDHIEDAFYPTL